MQQNSLDEPRPVRPVGLLDSHARFLVCALSLLTLSRLGLMAWQGTRLGSPGSAATILVSGLRMDLVLVSYLLAPALLFALILGGTRVVGSLVSRCVSGYLAGALILIAFFEVVTPAFIQEYDSRPNRLFIEYLVHPKEVGAMLMTGYRLEILVTGLATTAIAWVAWKILAPVSRPTLATGWGRRVSIFCVSAPLVFLGARSSLQHRPANPSSVVFSADHLLNDLCLSSLYSVAYAANGMKDESDAGEVYGHLESDEAVIAEVRRSMSTVPPDAFLSESYPTLHTQVATRLRERPLNLVIILEESLGAQYCRELGGEPVTQFLDTLSEQGWWFDNMYATGTRSVRGIEAVVSGFLPTPARSTVKLGLSQSGFFTLAMLLGSQGYHTQFIYGGESHFDNMKRFFTGNGFQEIVDRDDFEAPEFVGSWGVSDEDIFRKAHEEYSRLGSTPFFSLVFSVSNHSPWEYPAGKVTPIDAEPATARNTVRYADHALRTFFDLARSAPYWENTVFLVVADHDSRVYGASLVPIEHFHIPAVILGPGIEPRRDSRVVSQIDLGPTLLSLMGVSGAHPMVGFDLTALPDDAPGRAIMQYGRNQAFMEGERVVVLQPELPPMPFRWDGRQLEPAEEDAALSRRALAHALLPSMLYREQKYRAEPLLDRPLSILHSGLVR